MRSHFVEGDPGGRLLLAILLATLTGCSGDPKPEPAKSAPPRQDLIAERESGQKVTNVLNLGATGVVYAITQPSSASRQLDTTCLLFVGAEGKTSAFTCPSN